MHSSKVFPGRRFFAICMIVMGGFSLLPQNSDAQICGGFGSIPRVTSEGTEFLVCFERNIDTAPTDANYVDIYLASASDSPSTVTITCKLFPKLLKVFTLPPRSSTVYRLTDDPIVGNAARIESFETIDLTVFRVVATNPIACYGMNNKGYSADAFLALPRNVASTDYRVMSYYNSSLTGMEMPSEFCVAAFDTLTEVTIIPSATTSSGNAAGKELKFTLNNGEAVQISADKFTPHLDMTGSVVKSNKQVVVYGGHARTETPIDYFYNDNTGQHTSRDHLCEAMPPTSTWGTSFIAKNFGRDSGDILRVLALNDNTVVRINGKIWCTLMADKFRDTIIDQDNSVALNNIVTVETADSGHRVLVGMIAHTAINGGNGDPFLAIVPPLNQTYTDFTYFINNDAINYLPDQQFLIIATERSNVGNISIGANKLPAVLFTPIPGMINGREYSVTTLNQPMGIGRIQTSGLSETGFTILAYGWGPLISYGYTAGALLKPIGGIMPVKSPLHSFAPGDPLPKLPPPGITVRNIVAEKVYFDRAEITYSQNIQKIPVRLKKDIALETGTIEMGEEKTLELITAAPITETIAGNVQIWYHSRLWFDMWPVDFPFVITPQQQADVKGSSDQTVLLENYPNPVSGKTTVRFAIPSRSYASVKIYDALGRVVRTLSQGIMNSGEQTLDVNTKGISAGDYTLELVAPELGISEHRHLIVFE